MANGLTKNLWTKGGCHVRLLYSICTSNQPAYPPPSSPPCVQPHPCVLQLDAGVQEQILLLSRDEQSMLVASYADVKVRAR